MYKVFKNKFYNAISCTIKCIYVLQLTNYLLLFSKLFTQLNTYRYKYIIFQEVILLSLKLWAN